MSDISMTVLGNVANREVLEAAMRSIEVLTHERDKLIEENAALNETTRKHVVAYYEILEQNAALRDLLAEPYQFFRFGHKALMPWGNALDGWCERAEKFGVGKAQP